jgi:hypothetical protein
MQDQPISLLLQHSSKVYVHQFLSFLPPNYAFKVTGQNLYFLQLKFCPTMCNFTPSLKTLTKEIDQAPMHLVTSDEAIAKAEDYTVYSHCDRQQLYCDQLFVFTWSTSCNVIKILRQSAALFFQNFFSKLSSGIEFIFCGLLIQYEYEIT